MYALVHGLLIHILCGDTTAAGAEADELVALANEKGALFWKAQGQFVQGCLLAISGQAEDAIHMINAGTTAWGSIGSTFWMPFHLSHVARAYAALGQFDSAWSCIGDAMTAAENTKERWYEAEIYRVAGELARLSPSPDLVQAEEYFERALAIARAQQARSWELRAAMSLARMWCEEDKPHEARDCLAPVHAWFTEGFDTADLRQATALLDTLSSNGAIAHDVLPAAPLRRLRGRAAGARRTRTPANYLDRN
jgi:predicted ATPase